MNFKPKSEFSQNVLILMTGTSIAQAIPIAISPILTRIYTPEDFGTFALYMSIVSIIAVLATARYEQAIILPKKDEDSINIVALSMLIALCISFISLVIIVIFNESIVNLIGIDELSSWLYLIPISVFLTGVYQSLNYWTNRKKQYKQLATSKVAQSVATATTNLGLGSISFGFGGLILARLTGQLISVFVLLKKVLVKDRLLFEEVKILKVLALMKRYKKFPIVNSANAIIDSLRLASINILIARFFTHSVLGQFVLAWQMVQIPISLLGTSLSQVFFQKISKVRKEELHEIVKIFLIKASLVSLPIFLIIYFFAVDIFEFVFGKNWKLAGTLASTMAPWIFLNFLSGPMASVFIVLNKQELVLKVSILYMLVPISILIFGRDLEFLYLWSLITYSMSLILLGYIILALLYTRKEHKNVV